MSPLARAATFSGRTRQDALLRFAARRSTTPSQRAARPPQSDDLRELLAQILALDATNRTLLLRAAAIAGRND